MKKILVCFLAILIAFPSVVFCYDYQTSDAVSLQVIKDACVIFNYQTGDASAHTPQVASYMGDGNTTLACYRSRNMSEFEDNAADIYRTFLTFDISKVNERDIYDAYLKLNCKFNCTLASNISVYEADALQYTGSNDLISKYSNIDDVESVLGSMIADYDRPYDENTKGHWMNIDISTYIRQRARLGYTTATIMIEYVPPKYNANYFMFIATKDTAYAPKIECNLKPVNTVDSKLTCKNEMLVKTNSSTSANTQVAQNDVVGNMNTGTVSSSWRLNSTGHSNISAQRLLIEFDLSQYLYEKVTQAKLNLQLKFVGNDAGILNLYSVDGVYSGGLDSFLSTYTNATELNGLCSNKIASYSRGWQTLLSGSKISMDITGYVKEHIAEGKSRAIVLLEYSTTNSNSAYCVYVANNATGYGPSIAITSDSDTPMIVSRDDVNNTVTINKKIYMGTPENPINANGCLASYSDDGMLLDVDMSEIQTLNGNGNLFTLTAKTDKMAKYKFMLWENTNNKAPLTKPIDNAQQGSSMLSFDDAEGIYPLTLYTVTNDSTNPSRNQTLSVYVDYLYNHDNGILFKEEGQLSSDHFDIPIVTAEEMGGKKTIDKSIEMPLFSDKYFINPKTIIQKSTAMSKEIKSPIRLLCLGDSITEGYGTGITYWQYAEELFWKESVDFGDSSRKIMTLGTNYKGISILGSKTRNLSYNGSDIGLHSFSEGRGGWMASNFLYHPSQYLNSEANYKLAGGTQTWANSLAQKDFIQTHPISSTAEEPNNVFFDNDKEGDIKFSIKKWLERYRTHDSNGNPLELGNGTGTYVTASNINKYQVCEPTHVLLQFGTNDMRYYSEEQFRANLWKLVNEIKKDVPGVTVIISMTPPQLGTFNAELYPGTKIGEPDIKWWNNAKYLNNYFSNYDQKANKVYLLPTYFITQTVDAYDKTGTVSAANIHPIDVAHKAWGYQLYSLLKYMQ